MAYLGFAGNETNSLTIRLKDKTGGGVPWLAVIISAIPSLLALMTATNDPNAAASKVPFFMGKMN